jgi:hypothetical protein
MDDKNFSACIVCKDLEKCIKNGDVIKENDHYKPSTYCEKFDIEEMIHKSK